MSKKNNLICPICNGNLIKKNVDSHIDLVHSDLSDYMRMFYKKFIIISKGRNGSKFKSKIFDSLKESNNRSLQKKIKSKSIDWNLVIKTSFEKSKRKF